MRLMFQEIRFYESDGLRSEWKHLHIAVVNFQKIGFYLAKTVMDTQLLIIRNNT